MGIGPDEEGRPVVITRVDSPEDMADVWTIRRDVFVVEQNVPLEEEMDDLDHDPSTIHLLARDELGPLATGRILLDSPGHVHLGRICVARRVRGTGLGKRLLLALEATALDVYAVDGVLTVALSAQRDAQGFYESVGYSRADDREYLDAGIWHRDMVKRISRATL